VPDTFPQLEKRLKNNTFLKKLQMMRGRVIFEESKIFDVT